jgi:hypothetical protein
MNGRKSLLPNFARGVYRGCKNSCRPAGTDTNKKFPRTKPLPMPLLATDRRADTYRRHAIELAEQARREDDKGRRRYLLDLARNYIAVADQIDPPLDEPPISRGQ